MFTLYPAELPRTLTSLQLSNVLKWDLPADAARGYVNRREGSVIAPSTNLGDDKPEYALPPNLRFMALPLPKRLSYRTPQKYYSVFPPLHSAPHHTKLRLLDLCPTVASMMHTLPCTITDLSLHFTQIFLFSLPPYADACPPLSSSNSNLSSSSTTLSTQNQQYWLPNLRSLEVSRPFFDLRSFQKRIAALNVFKVSQLAVHASLLPDIAAISATTTSALYQQFDDTQQDGFSLTETVLWFYISRLLPVRHRPAYLEWLIEWNQESISKLPRTTKILHLKLAPFGLFHSTALGLSGLPSSLTHLSIDEFHAYSMEFDTTGLVDEYDEVKLLNSLPLPALLHFSLFCEGSLTDILLKSLPKSLITLNLNLSTISGDASTLKKRILSFLPKLVFFYSNRHSLCVNLKNE